MKYDTYWLMLIVQDFQIKDEPADPREHVEAVMEDAEPVRCEW